MPNRHILDCFVCVESRSGILPGTCSWWGTIEIEPHHSVTIDLLDANGERYFEMLPGFDSQEAFERFIQSLTYSLALADCDAPPDE